AGPRQTGDLAAADGVRPQRDDDWNDGSGLHQCGDGDTPRNDNIDLETDELSGDLGEAVATSLRPAILDRDGAVLDPSELRQSADVSGSPRTPDRGGCPATHEAYGRDLLLPPTRRTLRVRRERPRHRAPNHFDEIASPHVGTQAQGRVVYPLTRAGQGLKTIGAAHGRCLGKSRCQGLVTLR